MNTEGSSNHTHFSLSDLPPQERYPIWKESISVIFDVEWEETRSDREFEARISSAHLGQMILGETLSVGQRFDRTPQHIRQDGVDHCLIQIYLEGESRGLWGAREHSSARAGDVLFLDTAQPVKSEVSDFRNLTLVVPRTLLAPHLSDPERYHGRILRRESCTGRLLGENLKLIWDLMKTTSPDEACLMGAGMLDLVGRYYVKDGLNELAPESPTALTLREIIRKHIEQVLEDPTLGSDTLAPRFGLSRASLYRLFTPLGGVTAYIQTRRLHRAHALLMSAGPKGLNVTRLAFSLGFKHPSHFSRAFREKFGYSPTEVQDISLPNTRGCSAGAEGIDRSYERWVRELG